MSFLQNVGFSGMKVVMNMDKESREWGPTAPPDGATGVLVKRIRNQRPSARFGVDRYFSEPGIYESDGAWIVQMDDPELGNMDFKGFKTGFHLGASTFDVHPESVEAYNERANRLWHDPVNRQKIVSSFDQESILDNRVKVADLPETKAWELDELIVSPAVHQSEEEVKKLVVSSINYDWGDEPVYSVQALDAKGSSLYMIHVRESAVVEVIRGNVWKYEHGEPLTFKSLEEEDGFFKGLGQAREVANPETGLYSWTLEEFLEAVKNDVVDCMTNGFIPLTQVRSISAYRFTDRELGDRLREATLAGFGINAPSP